MSDTSVYDAWAGEDNPWGLWVKPALFATAGARASEDPPSAAAYRQPDIASSWSQVDASWAHGGARTAVFVDLDGAESLRMGLALARWGYRPILSINATTGSYEIIDMEPVIAVLREAAAVPRALRASLDAPPAFILDARRMRPERDAEPFVLDNRWMLFASDFPSASFMKGHGITRALTVVRGALQPDLVDLLARYQRGGLALAVIDLGADEPRVEPLDLSAGTSIGRLMRAASRKLQLGWRNADGSYGARVPVPRPSHG